MHIWSDFLCNFCQ